MEFTNATTFPASMQTGSMGDLEMLGIMVCKATYRLEGDTLTVVSGDDVWPVFEKPFKFSGVTLGAELDFRKENVDILVFGNVTAPKNAPIREISVSLESGDFSFGVMVFGDRRWCGDATNRLIAGKPEPFTSMPLTNDRAYGGQADWDGVAMPHSVNPDGRGFYLSESEAEGKLLPNLEFADQLIQSWSDQPESACFYKPAGMLGITDAMQNDRTALSDYGMTYSFQQSVPRLVTRCEKLGPELRLSGFASDGDIVIPLPPQTGFVVEATVGQLRSRFPATLSTLVILTEPRVVVASYRCLFRYLFQPEEQRRAELQYCQDGVTAMPMKEHV